MMFRPYTPPSSSSPPRQNTTTNNNNRGYSILMFRRCLVLSVFVLMMETILLDDNFRSLSEEFIQKLISDDIGFLPERILNIPIKERFLRMKKIRIEEGDIAAAIQDLTEIDKPNLKWSSPYPSKQELRRRYEGGRTLGHRKNHEPPFYGTVYIEKGILPDNQNISVFTTEETKYLGRRCHRFYDQSGWIVDDKGKGSYVFKTYFADGVQTEFWLHGSYIAANLWMNAVIVYQVLILLKSSCSARRINQPSLKRVNFQAGTIVVVAAILGYITSILEKEVRKATVNEDVRKMRIFRPLFFTLMGLMFIPPIIYVVCITILIRYRGYIPSTNGSAPRSKAMRELAIFYLRIIGVFFGVWVPSMLCLDYSHSKNNSLVSLLAILVIAMQPILTFCAILTKSDARKYIYDLVTLSYLFGDCTTRREKDKTYEGDNRFSSTTHENDNNRLSIDLKEILDLGDDASESNNTEEQFRIIDSDATTPNVVAGADSGTNALEIISNNSWNGDVVSEQANNGRDVDLDDIEHPDILHPPVMEEVSN